MSLRNSANTPQGKQPPSGGGKSDSAVQKVVDETATKVVSVHDGKKRGALKGNDIGTSRCRQQHAMGDVSNFSGHQSRTVGDTEAPEVAPISFRVLQPNNVKRRLDWDCFVIINGGMHPEALVFGNG